MPSFSCYHPWQPPHGNIDMRLSDITARLAELDNRDAEALHARFHNPRLRGLLEGTPGRGKTSPADYPFAELIRARLLVAASDCGMSTDELAKMNEALNKPPAPGARHAPEAKTEGAYINPNGLHSIIRGASAGSDWVVTLRFTLSNGARDVHPIVSLRENLASDEDAGRAMDLLEGRIHVGTLTLPASDLVKPLLDEDA